FGQRDVNIDKSRRRIDSARDQADSALYFYRSWVVHRYNGDGRALLRGGKIFRFHAQFYFDLIFGNDLHQRTASWNNLSILRVQFGDHARHVRVDAVIASRAGAGGRSEEHTSELQSRSDLVCRLLLEKKNTKNFMSPLRSWLPFTALIPCISSVTVST